MTNKIVLGIVLTPVIVYVYLLFKVFFSKNHEYYMFLLFLMPVWVPLFIFLSFTIWYFGEDIYRGTYKLKSPYVYRFEKVKRFVKYTEPEYPKFFLRYQNKIGRVYEYERLEIKR